MNRLRRLYLASDYDKFLLATPGFHIRNAITNVIGVIRKWAASLGEREPYDWTSQEQDDD